MRQKEYTVDVFDFEAGAWWSIGPIDESFLKPHLKTNGGLYICMN
jgi:hypothetical protein